MDHVARRGAALVWIGASGTACRLECRSSGRCDRIRPLCNPRSRVDIIGPRLRRPESACGPSRYTKAAEQRTLARSAISRLAHNPSVHRVPNPSSQFGTNSEKPNEINVDLFNWRRVGASQIVLFQELGSRLARKSSHMFQRLLVGVANLVDCIAPPLKIALQLW